MAYEWVDGRGFPHSQPFFVQRPDDLPIASAVWDEAKEEAAKGAGPVPTGQPLGTALFRALGDIESEVIELRRRLAELEPPERG